MSLCNIYLLQRRLSCNEYFFKKLANTKGQHKRKIFGRYVITVCWQVVKVTLKTVLDSQVNQEPIVFSLSANRLSKYLLKER